MKSCVLGIDTSNYTTSVAIIDSDGQLIANIKRPLPVAEGERGLRQSDAVFAHIKNLPSAFSEAGEYLGEYEVCAVGVSDKPRNQPGSYMPCFLSGVSAAAGIRAAKGVPLYRFSHQCGHIMAAIFGSGSEDLLSRPFGAFHVSGGTTELVLAEYGDNGFSAQVVGGSLDLHAGQAIDRIGVSLGMRFPAGPEMERAALTYQGKIPHKKPPFDGCHVHLSGLENLAGKLYRDTNDPALVAAFVFDYIGASLEGIAEAFLQTYGEMPLVLGGGVMSSRILRERLCGRFDCRSAPPALSADNAVGIAYLTAKKVF